MDHKFIVILQTFLIFGPIGSARILAILPFFGQSHHRVYQPFLSSLSLAGHDITVYSPYPHDSPPANYTDVWLDNMELTEQQLTTTIQRATALPNWKCMDAMMFLTTEIHFGNFLENKQINKLIQSKETFDLIITEAFSAQEYALILGHILKAPTIAILTFPTNPVTNSYTGNTLSLSHIPNTCFSYGNKMNFYERLVNSISIIRDLYLYYNEYIPIYDRTLIKLYPGLPPLKDLMSKVSLTFTNSHMTTGYSESLPPNIVPIGGIHIRKEKPLPQEFQRFMDGAEHGVILFSLGTMVPDHHLPMEYFQMYINIFRNLKLKVLWKTMKDYIPGLPPNVKAGAWMPQNDILAHPNCVMFITHGGLLSQHEAIHYGVPVIAIPQFFDQHRNARYYEEKGVGITLKIEELCEEKVHSAIQAILYDPKYKENMKRLSRIFRDRPMSPSQTVVYWTEYVLRHGGALHLKPASTLLSWYQLTLLDVLAAVAVLILIFSSALYFLIKKIVSSVRVQTVSSKPIKTD